ncbi:hypothetical protein ACH5RR_037228 [Cinchona calisaya]|uniref:Transposase MuDR plant domain-containing protein n=1 Tax=Cinchona calisaya TaxID=153742 RepID=A0ABD2Y969_9GENT
MQSECESSSDDLKSLSGLDEETKRTRYLVFNERTDLKNPKFSLGLRFVAATLFRNAIRIHSIVDGKEIKFKKNEPGRIRAVCFEVCQWRILDSFIHDKKTIQVKRLDDPHTCGRVRSNKSMTSNLAAELYILNCPTKEREIVLEAIEKQVLDGAVVPPSAGDEGATIAIVDVSAKNDNEGVAIATVEVLPTTDDEGIAIATVEVPGGVVVMRSSTTRVEVEIGGHAVNVEEVINPRVFAFGLGITIRALAPHFPPLTKSTKVVNLGRT